MKPGKQSVVQALRQGGRPVAFICLFASLFINLLALTSPLYMIQLYDRVINSGSVDTLFFLTLFAAIAFIAYGALEMGRGWILQRFSVWIDDRSRDHFLVLIEEAVAAGNPAGFGVLTSLDIVRNFVAKAAKNLLDLPFAPLFLAAAFLIHTWIGIFTLLACLVMFGLSTICNRLAQTAQASETPHRAYSSQLLKEWVEDREQIRSTTDTEPLRNAISHHRRAANKASKLSTERVETFTGVSAGLRLFFQSAVLGLGGLLVLRGEIDPGLMIAASILFGKCLVPIEKASSTWNALKSARRAFKRLETFEANILSARTRIAPQHMIEGRLNAVGLSFTPPDQEKPVLNNFFLNAEPGSVTAIIGPGGSGKSILCKILANAMQPTSGRIDIDGVNRNVWLRSSINADIGHLPQSPNLKNGTIADLISSVGGPDAMPMVIAASRTTGFHDIVQALPDGYATVVGPEGYPLPAGDKRLLLLTRALFGWPRIVILDEPYSDLDPYRVKLVTRTLTRCKDAGCTVVVATHCPDVFEIADSYIVLANGVMQNTGISKDLHPKLSQNESRAAE